MVLWGHRGTCYGIYVLVYLSLRPSLILKSLSSDTDLTHSFPKVLSKKALVAVICCSMSVCKCLAPICQSSVV